MQVRCCRIEIGGAELAVGDGEDLYLIYATWSSRNTHRIMEPLVRIELTTSSLPRKIRPFLTAIVARKLFIPIKFIWATVGQFLLESGDNGHSNHWSKRARLALNKTLPAKLTTRHQSPHLPRFLPPAHRANSRPFACLLGLAHS